MKFGIAPRLGLALTLIAVASASYSSYLTYRDSRVRLIDEAQRRLAATATTAAKRMTSTLDETRRSLLLLSGNPEFGDILRPPSRTHPSVRRAEKLDDLAGFFVRLMRLNSNLVEIKLIDRADFGMERLRVTRGADGLPQRAPDAALQEKGHLEYVQRGMETAPGKVYGTPMSLRRSGGVQAGLGEPTILVSAPVSAEDGTVLGVVVLNLSLAAMFDDIKAGLPGDHELYLANRRGDYLLHPDPDKAFAFERGREARVQDEFPETALLFAEAAAPASVLLETGTAPQQVAAFIAQDIQGGPTGARFVFGLAQPLDALLASTTALSTRVIQLMLMFSVASVLAAMLIARALTRPLREMALAVELFSKTGEMVPLPVERGDEIGQLARAAQRAEHQISANMKALETSRAEMMHLARHDPLTGVPNRLLFNERCEFALARAQRTGQSAALLLIDLDNFKPVNDTYGHAAGDAVLVALAQRLPALVRETDTVARFGGDEFAVLLEAVENVESVEQVAQKMLRAISAPIAWQGKTLQVGASIGINVYPQGGDSVDLLMSGADLAMYRAKTAGNGVSLFVA